MILLSCAGLSRGFNEGPLFRNLGFEIYSGERVGLVGPNGCGKTTLMRILAGLDRPDEGDVRRHAGARVSILRQVSEHPGKNSLFAEARSALNELVAAQDDMVRTAEKLAAATDEAERKALAARYDRLNEMLRHHDAYEIDHRIEQVLSGLGFRPEDHDRPVDSFSGGQQRRLMLAQMLLSAPDVMLLDEPSNHLDIGTTRWLEDYLVKQPEAMLIVSHDRYFLDKVVTKVFELHGGRLSAYPGNYKAYVRLRQERYEQQLKAYEAQQEYVQKQEEYIRRVHYGQLHKQAESRRKALDRLDRVERPVGIDAPKMHFGEVRRAGDVVIRAERLAKAYDKPLFTDLSFDLPRGKRLGIMGPNGCGKTTLLKIMLGEEKPDAGKVQQGHLTDLGYYDQHLKSLPEDETVMKAVWPDDDPETKAQQIRDLLGRFGLPGDRVHQRIGDLSGGERSRAALARLVALGVNVLVLDEPTNHLDIWACDALEQSLLEYEGTVIVVSHDRYFLNRVVDLLIVFEGEGKTQVVHGNYDTYERLRVEQEAARAPAKAKEAAKAKAAEAAKAAGGVESPSAATGKKRKRKFPYRKAADIEVEIAETETKVQELEQLLASGDLYRDATRVKETTKAFEEAKLRLHQLYEHWEEAVELNG